MTFEEWMRDVDLAVEAISGVSTLDLPDWGYRDAFEDGLTADEAADAILEENEFDLYV